MELNCALIGSRIKRIRKSEKLMQERLSEIAGISPQHMSQIESAKTKLSLPTLVNICNSLNVSADKILCDVLTADTTEQINADIADTFKSRTTRLARRIQVSRNQTNFLSESVRILAERLSQSEIGPRLS